MKRILFLFLLLIVITCCAQNPIIPSVAGVSLGDDFDVVIEKMDNRFDKFRKSSEGNVVTYYDVNVGGIYYKYGAFYYIYRNGRKVLNNVRLYNNYEISELHDAKSMREHIASVYRKKYNDMEERKDKDGFKFYVCCLNISKDFFWILIDLQRSKSDGGKYYYYTSVSYGPLYTESTDDI